MGRNKRVLKIVNEVLNREQQSFISSNPLLVDDLKRLNIKILDFFKDINAQNIEIKITKDKSIFIVIKKEFFEVFMELFIENDNNDIEGIVKIFHNNIIHTRKYGKHDYLLYTAKYTLTDEYLRLKYLEKQIVNG
jgi:hypothetical protein